jgi:signal transduction histidine kinase/CheY-like chemotaxis protein/HAMP domain-containing protein
MRAALQALEQGDFGFRLRESGSSVQREIARTFNNVALQSERLCSEICRIGRTVGREGKMTDRAEAADVQGGWRETIDSVNALVSDLVQPTTEIGRVLTAVAEGDLSQKMLLEMDRKSVQGEFLRIGTTVNRMVDQLGAFAAEVTRVAREVGTEGKLGGQAQVPGVAGTWKDLTDNVNSMARRLTDQVRNIALVTTAVANGDLSQKITAEAQGEVLELKNTINTMVDQLSSFASEVTRMAREVGTEGRLGGQASVPGVGGTWKDLVDNVNQLANNLTIQVRAIADVATAVTRGNLTRTITVEAKGEVDELKNNINRMIGNLKETTERNEEQDWLKTNLAKFSRMMQGQKDLETVSRLIMSQLTPLVGAHYGAFFVLDSEGQTPVLQLLASYAFKERKHLGNRFRLGEGLVGQAALEKLPILLTQVPEDYVQISSGLGAAAPRNIIVLPILFEGDVKAVIELASFQPFSQIHQLFLHQLAESVGVVLNMIAANMRTEELLEQSQALAGELRAQSEELKRQQEELRRSNAELETQAQTLKSSEELLKDQQERLQKVNEELEDKAALLADQNRKVEQKNAEIEQARRALEEKASQLALTSKYKSEFLANMSHELRTPLNSLLILAKQLTTNAEGNLSSRQVEFAQTILSSGTDLLTLINDILDLSKIEVGKMEIQASTFELGDVAEFCERSFQPVARERGLNYQVEITPAAPRELHTDRQRLQQVLKNLLANAFKFTAQGGIKLRIGGVGPRRLGGAALETVDVIEFAVIDSGIGIPREKQAVIFEAFQQADGTTSRRYGGTGLGLSISREIARLLGGEIVVGSAEGQGSTFTLYLPVRWQPPSDDRPVPGPDYPVVRAFQRAAPQSGPQRQPASASERPERYGNPLRDDRDAIKPGDRVLLIIEDDARFARILLDLARERNFKALVALNGESGLRLAHEYKPGAITLDICLPDMDGWLVLERLKHHPATRHIPIHIVSSLDKRLEGLRLGAVSYLEKPVSKEALEDALDLIGDFIDQGVRSLLLVEEDASQRRKLIDLVGDDYVEVTAVTSAREALDQLQRKPFDCIVLDLELQDMSLLNLLETIRTHRSARSLPLEMDADLQQTRDGQQRKRYAVALMVNEARSAEQLLQETALFLQRLDGRSPERQSLTLEAPRTDVTLAGKRVLIADDDVRNVFALTSLLEAHEMQVFYAENGRQALEVLQREPALDIVLMDVMMPEMDGFEAMRAIRARPALRTLPIIALTAKAMKGDREKCMEAGASDYISKPVDTDQLLFLLRSWLRPVIAHG